MNVHSDENDCVLFAGSGNFDGPETADELIRRVKAGDKDALAALVADYLPLVCHAACRLPVREREDAVAEGQYELIRAIQAFDPDYGLDLTGYLKIKIDYAMFNYQRRYHHDADRTAAEGDILERVEALQAGQTDPRDSPAAQVLRQMNAEQLRAAMAELTPREQACLESLFWRGMTYVETAQTIGVQVSSVSCLRSRALKKLKLKIV